MATKKKQPQPNVREEKSRNELVECPNCGEEREKDPDDGLYECVRCGAEGYDCCVPGTRAICNDCQDDDDLRAEDEEEE